MKILKNIFTNSKWRIGKPPTLPRRLITSTNYVNSGAKRATHINTSHRSDIDRPWGKYLKSYPNVSSNQAICEDCHSAPATETSSKVCLDLEPIPTFYFKYNFYCSQCWNVQVEENMKKEPEHVMKKAAIKDRVDTMMEELNRVLPEEIEEVPVKYAASKIKNILSERKGIAPGQLILSCWVIQSSKLRQDLRIKKVKKQWICDKNRIDAMDLELWLSYHWSLWESNDG